MRGGDELVAASEESISASVPEEVNDRFAGLVGGMREW